NEDEKTIQVRVMDKIYSNAYMVICCIGTANKDTEKGMHYANYKCDYLDATYGRKARLSRRDQKHYNKEYHPSSKEIKDREAFFRLFEKKYWSRMWIRQELVLAPRCLIRCGKSCIGLTKTMFVFRTEQDVIPAKT